MVKKEVINVTEQINYVEELVRGLDPSDPSTIALRKAAEARPVSALERPLGRREETSDEAARVENLNGLTNWNDVAREHPWG